MTNIKQARIAAGLSQKEVAITLAISSPSVSEWESGKKFPAAKNLIQLADLYGTTTDYLLGRENTKKEPAVGELLSREERELITIFKSMNSEGREKVYEFASLLAGSGEYIKTGLAQVVAQEA